MESLVKSPLLCEKCCEAMDFQYEVAERKVLFVLWNCECGHKVLERKRLEPLVAR